MAVAFSDSSTRSGEETCFVSLLPNFLLASSLEAKKKYRIYEYFGYLDIVKENHIWIQPLTVACSIYNVEKIANYYLENKNLNLAIS